MKAGEKCGLRGETGLKLLVELPGLFGVRFAVGIGERHLHNRVQRGRRLLLDQFSVDFLCLFDLPGLRLLSGQDDLRLRGDIRVCIPRRRFERLQRVLFPVEPGLAQAHVGPRYAAGLAARVLGEDFGEFVERPFVFFLFGGEGEVGRRVLGILRVLDEAVVDAQSMAEREPGLLFLVLLVKAEGPGGGYDGDSQQHPGQNLPPALGENLPGPADHPLEFVFVF